jgi:hypothetical protein
MAALYKKAQAKPRILSNSPSPKTSPGDLRIKPTTGTITAPTQETIDATCPKVRRRNPSAA